MKQASSLLLATTLALAVFSVSQLQAGSDRGRNHGPPDAEMRVARMSRVLDLSDEQSARLLELFQAVDEERQALHEQAMLQLKPQICEIQASTRAGVSEILDEEQLAQMDEMMALQSDMGLIPRSGNLLEERPVSPFHDGISV